MSAWTWITTALALSSLARLKAASSQRKSAAVRSAISCDWAGLIVGAEYQMSLSLFEPPGILSVTNNIFDCCHITFSTNLLSLGQLGSKAWDCESTGWRPPLA